MPRTQASTAAPPRREEREALLTRADGPAERVNLTQLANEYGSDKGSIGVRCHKYTYLYDLLFFDRRMDQLNLLEMGLARGGPEVGGPADRNVISPSIQMWLNYFPRAKIFGFDVSDFSHMKNARFHFERGSSAVEEDLQRVAGAAPYFDIIIDDASHASYHQQLAFRVLFPHLGPGGLYIIEDLHWQPAAYEKSLPNVPRTGEFMESFFERAVYEPNAVLSKAFMDGVKRNIFSYASFPAFSKDGVSLVELGGVRLTATRKSHATKLVVLRKNAGSVAR